MVADGPGSYQDCDCVHPTGMFDCGCGQEHAAARPARMIHWQGQHWYLICAFEQALVALERGV
jgi:hypothetical protein